MSKLIHSEILAAIAILSEEEDYTRAAHRIGITPSRLERQVSDLEEELGLRLFEQNGMKVKPTENGQIFVEACRSFLEADGSTRKSN